MPEPFAVGLASSYYFTATASHFVVSGGTSGYIYRIQKGTGATAIISNESAHDVGADSEFAYWYGQGVMRRRKLDLSAPAENLGTNLPEIREIQVTADSLFLSQINEWKIVKMNKATGQAFPLAGSCSWAEGLYLEGNTLFFGCTNEVYSVDVNANPSTSSSLMFGPFYNRRIAMSARYVHSVTYQGEMHRRLRTGGPTETRAMPPSTANRGNVASDGVYAYYVDNRGGRIYRWREAAGQEPEVFASVSGRVDAVLVEGPYLYFTNETRFMRVVR